MKTYKSVLNEMLLDINKINKTNIDFVINNLPVGEYTLVFSKSTITADMTIDERQSAFFLIYHDCLDHRVYSTECWGYKFLETLFDQIK